MVRLSCRDKTERQVPALFAMNKITQTMRYRQSLIHYAQKHGVTKAAIRYHTNRQYIYRWLKRYDGTLQSLADRSHRPHSHPNQHTPEEIKLILNMLRRNKNTGLVVFWVKLRQRGYTRSISGLYRFLRKRNQLTAKLPNPKYVPKPYEKMQYPGQRVQIDVKFVPEVCIVGQEPGTKWYQYQNQAFADYLHRKTHTKSEEQCAANTGAERLNHSRTLHHIIKAFQFLQLAFLTGKVFLSDCLHLCIFLGRVVINECIFIHISSSFLVFFHFTSRL